MSERRPSSHELLSLRSLSAVGLIVFALTTGCGAASLPDHFDGNGIDPRTACSDYPSGTVIIEPDNIGSPEIVHVTNRPMSIEALHRYWDSRALKEDQEGFIDELDEGVQYRVIDIGDGSSYILSVDKSAPFGNYSTRLNLWRCSNAIIDGVLEHIDWEDQLREENP